MVITLFDHFAHVTLLSFTILQRQLRTIIVFRIHNQLIALPQS